jgi:Kef-type K+ transport system membrane component KefB
MNLPIASASATQTALVALFVVLLAAKIGEEICRRIGQPPIIGEILAGVLIGPSVLGFVEPDEVLEVFSELGVVFLLFMVGLETKLEDMRAVGRTALNVGLMGVIVPLIGGFALGEALGKSTEVSLFIGAALMATSAGITSAVLMSLGVGSSRPARTILGAAVVDDVLALVLLSVIVGTSEGGGVSISSVAFLLLGAVVFIGVVAVGGSKILARYPKALIGPAFSTTGLLPAVLLCLGLAALAGEIGLAAIIGAFLAGMIVAETKGHTDVEAQIKPLYAFFPPFFFAYIGLEVDLAALGTTDALLLLAGITVLAVITKLAGGWIGGHGMVARERLIVAVGMVPRGEVGIIVAGIGASAGVVDDELFAVIVGMAVLTTLITPPFLRRLTQPAEPERATAASP